MNNPIKSQIAANRERFDDKIVSLSDMIDMFDYEGTKNKLKDISEDSQTSLLQTAIAVVGELFDKIEDHHDKYIPNCERCIEITAANFKLSKVVELLKGGIEK